MIAEWFDTTADVRDRVASVYENNEETWTQGQFAKFEDSMGDYRTCDYDDGRATCWCVTGLILLFEHEDRRTYLPDDEHEGRNDVRLAIESFNDDSATTVEEIIRRLRKREAPFNWAS